MGQCVLAAQKPDKSKRRKCKNAAKSGKNVTAAKEIKINKQFLQIKPNDKHQRFSVDNYEKKFSKVNKEILLTNDTQKQITDKPQGQANQPQGIVHEDPNISNLKNFSLNNINSEDKIKSCFFDTKEFNQQSDEKVDFFDIKVQLKEQDHSMYEMNDARDLKEGRIFDQIKSQTPLDSSICCGRSVTQQVNEQENFKHQNCLGQNQLKIERQDCSKIRQLCFSPKKRISMSQIGPVKPLRRKKRTFETELNQLRPLDRVKPFLNMEDAQISKFLQETS